MTGIRPEGRRRPAPFRTALTALGAAGVFTLTLTACGPGGSAAAPGSSASATATASGGAGAEAGATPSGKVTAGTGAATAAPTATPTTPATSAPAGSPAPASGGAAAEGPATEDPAGTGTDCDHKMPVSPDEIAVLRYTPEGGSLSLIFKHGNWDCPTPDSDGPPFVTVGKETFLPLNQAAHITVTDPIVASTENQEIGVQEFLDWLETHPNSGLVFTYHVGADGAIDSLEQIFTP
ncbi:hypothetical protein [Streptomyces sp. JB150]|uniref:hypothetical protein n=1 Tax=Streptomyces sp. JB150 TaxID=2714844 RepID=UPI00140A1789|nr:hypothetical protein [Streptomyces sp. JB150]QIJ60682.1 hypothetical protein G7Z13_00510 [Streptomyces sp. JB150]